jgi:ABC-type transport system involved in multi-copper enzyme maturation permease subunit
VIHNPLLLKEFRQRMRTVRAPIVITGYFLGMALITFFLLYENVQGQLSLFLPARSEQVFVTLSLLQTIVAAFLTPAFAAGSISGERERRTLAVLLTTPLSPAGILLGKVLSSSALLALLLVVTLPLYSLVFLFGGAVPQEVITVFAFQLFTVVLIAAISVMWSTISLRSGWSTVLSYATVTWMVFVTGALGYGLHIVAERFPMEYFVSGWGDVLLNLNPLWILACIENPGLGTSSGWLWFVAVYVGLCVLLAIPSVWRLRPQAFRFLPGAVRAEERDYQ